MFILTADRDRRLRRVLPEAEENTDHANITLQHGRLGISSLTREVNKIRYLGFYEIRIVIDCKSVVKILAKCTFFLSFKMRYPRCVTDLQIYLFFHVVTHNSQHKLKYATSSANKKIKLISIYFCAFFGTTTIFGVKALCY